MQNLTEEEIKKIKLRVCTPMYGGSGNVNYFRSILELQKVCLYYGLELDFDFIEGESLITRARNDLANEFLDSDSTHLLFIDADISFNPISVFELLIQRKDIVGATYPVKDINWKQIWECSKSLLGKPDFDQSKFEPEELSNFVGRYTFNPEIEPKEGGGHKLSQKSMKLNESQKVLDIATGFLLIKREVFEKIKSDNPHLKFKEERERYLAKGYVDYQYAFFDTGICEETNRYLSEDYFFCKLAKNSGFDIWLCPWIPLTHIGPFDYVGNISKITKVIGGLVS